MAYNNGNNTVVIDREAERHNSRINGLYTILQTAESEQLEQLWEEATRAPRASVVAPEKPAETPVYEHTPVQSDLFTAATLDRTLERTVGVQAPAYTPVASPAIAVTPTAKPEAVSFSLTTAAKKAIAVFASAVTIMTALICVNTQIINAREAQIASLEAANAGARLQLAQIESDIERYSSEEEIRRWGENEGKYLTQG